MSSAIKTPAFQAKASNILNEDNSSIYSGGEWSFKNASAVTGFHVDADGKVGVGTTSPIAQLEASEGFTTRGIAVPTETNVGSIQLGYDGNNGVIRTWNSSPISYETFGHHQFLVDGTERMRIDAGGALRVGNTSGGTGASGVVHALGYATRTGGSGSFGSNAFNIFWSGTTPQLWIDSTNIGTISISSDYRIKKSVETQTIPALERIAQLRPVKYELADYKELFKADGVQREGFIAHELQAVIPSAVHGEKDDENQIQSLKLDALCAVMVKAIQELSAKVDAQAAEIEALKAK